jgi:hypothetical protein
MSRQSCTDVEVVIPLKWSGADGARTDVAEMAEYLRSLSRLAARVIVVDGSAREERRLHEREWGAYVTFLEPDATKWRRNGGPLNGKVVGALTGIAAATSDKVVLADDDVRHTHTTLASLSAALDHADLVRPANVYESWPWQARWDGARSLLNAAVGTDWPGTFGLRREAVLGAGGWDPHVLFENLELWRTVDAAGGRVASRPDIRVPRRPPSVRQFLDQRVRQAYDNLAQPGRLVLECAMLPAALLAARRSPARLVAGLGGVVAVAARERAQHSRTRARLVPPADVPLWSVAWLAERSVCVWLAIAQRVRGGVRYRGSRMLRAAHSRRELRVTVSEAPRPGKG